MKKQFNLVAIIVALALMLVGVVFVTLDITVFKTEAYVVCSVFCSVIASGIVLICTTLFIDIKKKYEVWDDWKLEKVFKTRAEKNSESDPKLETHKIKQLDGIAFGLSSFRSARKTDVLSCLQNGMKMRLLVMDPTSKFVKQREQEEHDVNGNISQAIKDLCKWAKDLNDQSNSGKITIKFYNAMTLDFYWRMDDDLYIGPYLLNIKSQQTITYKFVKGGKGFDYYTDYFESLWNDNTICIDASDVLKDK